MKRRIKKLEKQANNKNMNIYVLTDTDHGNYTYWGDEKETIFTPKDIEKLEAEGNKVIIVSWADDEK